MGRTSGSGERRLRDRVAGVASARRDRRLLAGGRAIALDARAQRAAISLEGENGSLRLCIEDDGVGFDPASPGAGIGLAGMRERAAWLGGSFAVDSAPGCGTRVRVEIGKV